MLKSWSAFWIMRECIYLTIYIQGSSYGMLISPFTEYTDSVDANINLRENGGRRAIDMLNNKSSEKIKGKSWPALVWTTHSAMDCSCCLPASQSVSPDQSANQ